MFFLSLWSVDPLNASFVTPWIQVTSLVKGHFSAQPFNRILQPKNMETALNRHRNRTQSAGVRSAVILKPWQSTLLKLFPEAVQFHSHRHPKTVIPQHKIWGLILACRRSCQTVSMCTSSLWRNRVLTTHVTGSASFPSLGESDPRSGIEGGI